MAAPRETRKISETVWEIPAGYKPGMLAPARIYATERLLQEMDAGVFDQVTNVATLPGIVRCAFCMPDGHWGYGFPIGGVAAMDPRTGVISPGGIGFDINCGMRLLLTNLTEEEVRPRLRELVDGLFARVLQHEIDHLNGILFVDHLEDYVRKELTPELKKIKKLNKK